MVKVDVRQATADDLERLIAREPDPTKHEFERERFAAQERGECALLIAWEGEQVRGRVRLRWYSKYVEIIDEFGEFPEINALDAWPPGEGIGSQIIDACEQMARERGDTLMGIAVVVTNVDARRLYERLGYEYWGEVIDEWSELGADGSPGKVHRDPAAYLIKSLELN